MTTPSDANLFVTQGVPYACQFRFVGATSIWPNGQGCEANSQVRVRVTDALPALDLSDFLTISTDGDDILVTLTLTGEQTRAISANGIYDLYLSDVGPTDAHAVRVSGRLVLTLAITRE